MTREEILSMPAGIEMDALVQKHIFGIKQRYACFADGYIPDNCCENPEDCTVAERLVKEGRKYPDDCEEWRELEHILYSNDIAATWMVVEKMQDCLHLCEHGKEGTWEACFCYAGPGKEASANSAPLAICRAALLSVLGL